jgi:hypothetical protein
MATSAGSAVVATEACLSELGDYTESGKHRSLSMSTHSEELAMATIVIKDLPENMELDRQAMQAITGGARLRGRPLAFVRASARSMDVTGDPGARRAAPVAAAKSRPRMSILFG